MSHTDPLRCRRRWPCAEEMRRDHSVLVFGEGMATKRRDLVHEFGAPRVRNTPLAEGIIAGTAVGAAAHGPAPGHRPAVRALPDATRWTRW